MSDSYNIPQLPGTSTGKLPVAASTPIAIGGMVALNASGDAVPAASTVTGHVKGIATSGVDNSAGAAGDQNVELTRCVAVLQLDATNPPTKAHIGKMVYAITPDTVAHTGTCRAGRLIGFDGTLPIVDLASAIAGPAVTIGNTDGTIAALTIGATYAQAEVQALRAACEVLGDDIRALVAGLKTSGTIA